MKRPQKILRKEEQSMKTTKLLLACAGATLVLGLASCGKTETDPKNYTYHSYSSALASNWNPHAWESSADSAVLSYLEEGLVSLTAKDTKNGVYQWSYDMAESIEDVTSSHPEDLVKYAGLTEEEAAGETSGYVYEIKLRDGLKWQNGDAISAESFVESGELLLDPAMKNYRANLYISGETAIAGAKGYYYQGSKVFMDNSSTGAVTSDADVELSTSGKYVKVSDGLEIYITLGESLSYLGGYSLATYVNAYGSAYFDTETWETLLTKVSDSTGRLEATAENVTLFKTFLDNSTAWGEDASYWVKYIYEQEEFPEMSFEDVGLYKVEDSEGLTFRYVMANPADQPTAFVSFAETWLVNKALYNSLKDSSGELVTTTYGTDVDKTMSYGPYKLQSLEASKQMVLVQNENWWGWTKDKDGHLTSETLFEVDGAKRQQYQATSVVIDVLDDAAAKQKFLAGELTEYSPTSSELKDYTLSDALYQVDETYTMSFFFNTDKTALKAMDTNEGNSNSVVLSNTSFRKAFSLAIDRAEYVTSTPAYKPAYSLMNNLYYYDVWNNPNSNYRNSEPAKQAIVDLYGVEYGEGKAYATLDEAYASINGYNLTEAKDLMKAACEELVASGDYTEGADIHIKVAYSKGAIQSDEQAQIALMNKYINAAVEGSGFGKVELEAVGNLEDRYGDVPAGKYAIGYGAWGGAAFYPFRNMQVYCDPDQYDINEAADWDPKTETLNIKFTYGDTAFDDTMTWQAWSNCMLSGGKYADADNEIKLRITAAMEKAYLDKYYRIPLCGTTAAFLLGYQVSYYTETYNIMYDFGGFRLLKFNYTDAQWDKYVKDHGGVIDYK